MSSNRRSSIDDAKNLAKRGAQSITSGSKKAASAAKSGLGNVKNYVLPSSRRRRKIESGDQMRKYSNLNRRGKPNSKGKADAKRRKKAEYLASLPKHPLKRFLYRIHPKRFVAYWFSKDGASSALKIAGIAAIVLLAGTVSIFAYFRKDLPDPRNITFEQAAKIYDRTGKTLLYTYGSQDQVRVLVEFDEISEHMKHATMAVEDQNFYNHPGFSVTGVTRAAISNVFGGDDSLQGGSTITQQFIKNALVGDERTFTRKVKELILAIELERLYTKDEILSFYLNQIPYGALEYGVEATANGFFNKSAKDLSIDEAALLAALPQAPSYYSPYGENLEELVGRQHFVIDQMVEQGYITDEEAAKAKETDTLKKIVPAGERSAYRNLKAPHFVLKVIDDLRAEYGEATVSRGGLTVITTIDLKAQKMAEKAVKDRYNQGGAMGDNAALVAEDTATGQVIAYVGSRDFNFKGYGSYDAATPEVGRQPGSSFKPYAYAEMFKNPRWSPGSIIWDSATNFNGYAPHDFDFRFPGPMTIRDAIGRSRNIPAVKALYIAGVDKVINLAQNMGVKSLCDTCDYGLSLVLGSGEIKLSEHVHGFSTFGRGGIYKPQTYVLKVTNSNNETLKEWKDGEGEEEVLDPQIAYAMTSILTDDVARSGTFGLGSNLVVPGYTVGAKTGTTDLSVDGWLMGYSKHVSAGVWVGNHDSKPMYTFAEPMVGPIWNQFMRDYHKGKKDVKFEKPEGIKNVKIDRATGRNASSNSRQVISDIAPKWFEGVKAGSSTKVTIDKISKKLATDCTPELARQESTQNSVAPELATDDPMFSAWAKSTGYSAAGSDKKEKDDVHKCSDAKPDITNFTVVGSDFDVSYNQGSHSLSGGYVSYYVDGKHVRTCKIPSNCASTSSSSITYNGSINKNVRVEVVDKVLYHDEATENTTSSGGTITISNVNINSCGGGDCNVSFDWNLIAGAINYRICGFPGGCQVELDTSFDEDDINHGDYNVTIEARNGSNDVIATGSRFFELDN